MFVRTDIRHVSYREKFCHYWCRKVVIGLLPPTNTIAYTLEMISVTENNPVSAVAGVRVHCTSTGAYGVELLRAVTFCTEIEYVKRNLLVGLGHKVALCSVSKGDEITLYRIAFPASVCTASHN